MIVGNDNRGFLVSHWELLAFIAGVAALVGSLVFAYFAFSQDSDAKADEIAGQISSMKKSGTGVKPLELEPYGKSTEAARSPKLVPDVPEAERSFLVSGRRVFCASCQVPIDGKLAKCNVCGAEQPKDVPVVLDSDGDGMPNEWEQRFGFNPTDSADADMDADGDGFTNYEEFMAKTDPTDAGDHPDYLDYVRLELPLQETVLPFYFKGVTKTPNGLRYQFFDPKRRNDYGKAGTTYAVMEGEAIGDTDFVATSYEEKSKKVKIKGSEQEKTIDVSVATIVRKGDGKAVPLVIDEKNKPIDIQANVTFDHGTAEFFVVVPGDEISLNGAKYKITDIKRLAKGASITLEPVSGGKSRTIDALEQ